MPLLISTACATAKSNALTVTDELFVSTKIFTAACASIPINVAYQMTY